MGKMVVALGGNAILSNDASAHAQQQALVQTSAYLVHLIKQGHRLIVSHGNGPQVGNLLLQQQAADSEKSSDAARYVCCYDTRKYRLLVVQCA